MKGSTIVVWVIVAIIVIVGIIVWMSYSAPAIAPTTSNSATTVQPVQSSAAVPVQILALTVSTDPTLGMHLVGPTGMTLYTYNKDTAGVSNCTGQCAQSWPPYTATVSTSLSVGAGITGAISTITRKDDGAMQVTYKGKPLYYWFKDVVPGDVTGQSVGGFSVVKP